ncbi:hypothetical protein, variant [Aphanomyces astaci]|uniref:Vesicle tethering protein Uso1/P115-like head domain-containing protein n=1 Tax=Aphanomyces astaci TaxID=112090 RepID=W4GKI8_APHAT|nr:hypothetical protein, variant [Aphanomyces astaci]ETV80177.1 hypothetical protein, variant [Aphanomyces astaci]|eukprot:XP_009830101.1 hypothetical protein, variant [Aphanomyces astaci]
MINIMKRFVESSVSQALHEGTQDADSAASAATEPGTTSAPFSALDPPRSNDRSTPQGAPPSRERTASSSSDPTMRRTVPKADLVMAIERFQYAMLLAERKTAVTQLQKLWVEADIPDDAHRLIIPVILNALVTDPRDTELMEAMLELMQSIVSTNPSNASILLQEPHALDTILGLMQDPSPWIRGPTVQLIKKVQDGDSASFATHILACQEGLRLLLEVVEDKREHIRDTAVQILLSMTLNQSPLTLRHVQQFLAFEDGFTRLFQIVDLELEGHGLDSAVLVDCLHVIVNMVRNNTMSQSLLRETPFVPVLFPLLLDAGLPSPDQPNHHPAPLEDDDEGNQPSSTGLRTTLDILLCLVGPVYPNTPPEELDEVARRDQTKRQEERSAVQAHLAQLPDVVAAVGEVACHGVTEADRMHALQVLHLLCEDNEAHQLVALTWTSMTTSPSYVLSMCLRLDVHHEETPLGASARTLLDGVWHNDLAKISILQHIHAPPPPPLETGPIEPVGQVLVKTMATTLDAMVQQSTATLSLTPKDAAKVVWKCCGRWRSLLHNSECKQLALRVPAPHATQAVSGSCFLNACVQWVMELPRSKATYPVFIALFHVILCWVHGCGPAIHEIVTSIPTLTFLCTTIGHISTSLSGGDDASHVEVELAGLSAMVLGVCLDGLDGKIIPLTKEQLLGLITRQIGLQKFTDAFGRMQQLASFQNSKRSGGVDGMSAVYDKGFVQWFKHVADATRVGILHVYMGNGTSSAAVGDDSRSKAYMDLIRMQDEQLEALRDQVTHLTTRGATSSCQATKNPLADDLAAAHNQIAELKLAQDRNETRIRGLTTANDLVERELQRKDAALKKLLHAEAATTTTTLEMAPALTDLSKGLHRSEEQELRVDQLENDVRRLTRQLQQKEDALDAARATIDMLSAHQAIAVGHKEEQEHATSNDNDTLERRVEALEKELREAHDSHTMTVSTLVARHEQATTQWQADATNNLNQALQSQARDLAIAHETQRTAWHATRIKMETELHRLENVFDQLHHESEKRLQLEAQVDNSHDVEPPQEVLMLVGSLEIQCRSFRDVLEQVLGPEGVSKALQLSQDRGAVPFWSSSC